MSFIRLKDQQGRIIFAKCCEIHCIVQTYPATTEITFSSGRNMLVVDSPSDILKAILDCEKKEEAE